MVKAIRPNVNIDGINRIINSNKAIIISKICETGNIIGPTIIGFLEPDKDLMNGYFIFHILIINNIYNSSIINNLYRQYPNAIVQLFP